MISHKHRENFVEMIPCIDCGHGDPQYTLHDSGIGYGAYCPKCHSRTVGWSRSSGQAKLKTAELWNLINSGKC